MWCQRKYAVGSFLLGKNELTLISAWPMASITSAAVKVTNQRETAALGSSRPVRERPCACQGNGTSNPVGGSGVPVIATPTRGRPRPSLHSE